MDEQIILDKTSFKALAVDSRVLILKTLGQRRHTQSELSAALDLSVPTVKEHLDALAKAGLVERQDDGHKWVYYALTKKGKAIINPAEKRFWIVLSVFILTIVGGITGFVRTRLAAMYSPVAENVAAPMAAKAADGGQLMASAPSAAPGIGETAGGTASSFPWGWVIIGAIIAVELGFVLYFWWHVRRQRQILGQNLK